MPEINSLHAGCGVVIDDPSDIYKLLLLYFNNS